MLYYTVKDPGNRIKAQFLVCGYENGLIQFIDDSLQGSYNKNFEIKAHRSRVIARKICEDRASDLSQYLVSFSYDNSILFIKLETLRIELTHFFEFPEKGIFNCLDFFGNYLIFGCEDGFLRFFLFEDLKLKFICKKHYLGDPQAGSSEFKTITTLKVFKNLLLVADNLGGLMVLDLQRMVGILNEFIRLKKERVQEKLEKQSPKFRANKENEKQGPVDKKKNLPLPDFSFKDFDLDIDFDWKRVSIVLCHSQKITRIMDLDGQAIMTSGNDCKTKLWVVLGEKIEERKPYKSPFTEISKK